MEGQAALKNGGQSEEAHRYYASPQQERLWSLLRDGGGLAYRSQQAILIRQRLDAERLQRAMVTAMNRHEILRTTFDYLPSESRLAQVVRPELWPAFERVSLIGRTLRDQQDEVGRRFDEMKRKPFDFENGPLWRVQAIELSDDKHVLLASIAALCGDSATLAQLLTELAGVGLEGSAYDGDRLDPLQYADFAQWQREAIDSEEAEAGRRYWRRKVLSSDLALDLPFLASRRVTTFTPAMIACPLDAARAAQLAGVSRGLDVPPSVFLLSAWMALLFRLTGGRAFNVGVRSDGRKYAELDKALGLFARYLPVECGMESHSRFAEVLGCVRQSVEESYTWQDCFTWERLAPSGPEPERPPFCSALFEFVAQPARSYRGDGDFSSAGRFECIEPYEVKLACFEKEEGPDLELHYDAGRFDVEGVRRLGDALKVLLESAIANPSAHVGELPLLGELERQHQLVELNDTGAGDAAEEVVHELFEKQAKRTPDSIAVVCEDQQVTYAALGRRAECLAHELRRRGVRADVPVALCAERGIDMVVGLLAVLKAGGAYVPLDAAYPKDRLAYMLEDSQATLMLTQRRMAKEMSHLKVEMIALDAEWESPGSVSAAVAASAVSPQNLVYVIYTSGSTGKPKGVAVEHRQLVNYSRAIAGLLRIREGEGHATLSTLAADLGNTAIFPALLTGGCLHVISAEAMQDAAALGDYFENHFIDYLKITPSHLAALHATRGGQRIRPRRTLILGGEAASAAWVRQLQEAQPDCKVINHYGPTETTVGALAYEVKAGESGGEPSASLPLGPPLANALVYILDDGLNALPGGASGEIYLGGAGVSRGYLNRPDLTASRFLPNPFARQAGGRLYRTGDRARRRADGAIDFLGRLDHQVKIRGFRIELGEIEAVLAEHPLVRTAVVLAREDRPGNKRMVAYIDTNGGTALEPEAIWGYLRDRLPDYMVPSDYVLLPSLPLTANGKVDRRALPAPETREQGSEADFTAPQTEVEAHLARIWADVLGLDRVSTGANFFRLGGDSILSIQIVSRAREAGYQLTERDIFERQTIAELAEVVRKHSRPVAEQGPVSGEVSLTPIQRRFFEQDFADPHHWNQSLLLETRQPLSASLLAETLRRLLEHHDSLRLRFTRHGEAVRQVYSRPDAGLPFAEVDIAALPELHQRLAVERLAAEAQASLNLAEGPLLRVLHFQRGGSRPDWLLIIIHHLAVDVVSWHVLLDDLQTGYGQLAGGQPVTLPVKTASYRQWAEQLTEYAQSPEVRRQGDYWLSGADEPVAMLPAELNGGVNSEGSTCAVTVLLDAQATEALLREVPGVYRVQVEDILLTALVQAVACWTGSSRLLVDLESHGRHDLLPGVDISRTVGWFTTRFPVLLDAGDSPAPGAALRSIKEQLRRLPQHGTGYGLLRYLSGDAAVAARLRACQQAQISFNYVGQFDQVFSNSPLFAGMRELRAPNNSPRAARPHLLEVIGHVAEGRLQFSFRYSQNVHRRVTMERLGEDFLAALRAIINHCLTDASGGLTPSDFPDVALSQNELDSLMAKFG
ncbi:MAG TPA: amino acid adenylation domain-containing protein [Blastocatellia bacterium]|nr:amino acid adenylation domain-containing protein [Blastocatellia bacterium]